MPIDYMTSLKNVPKELALWRRTVTTDRWDKLESSDQIWLALQI